MVGTWSVTGRTIPYLGGGIVKNAWLRLIRLHRCYVDDGTALGDVLGGCLCNAEVGLQQKADLRTTSGVNCRTCIPYTGKLRYHAGLLLEHTVGFPQSPETHLKLT